MPRCFIYLYRIIRKFLVLSKLNHVSEEKSFSEVQDSKRGVLSQFFKCDSEGIEPSINLISFKVFVPENYSQ